MAAIDETRAAMKHHLAQLVAVYGERSPEYARAVKRFRDAMPATRVLQESAGLAPRGKYHLEGPDGALCGAQPRMSPVWNVHGDRAEFERAVPHRICKRCRRAEEA